MASFDLATGEDTDPAWYETFYKPADQDWWDTGPHKALGQSFLRALVRQVAPELGAAESGDLGLSDTRCDLAVPIAFPDVLSTEGAGLCILRAAANTHRFQRYCTHPARSNHEYYQYSPHT